MASAILMADQYQNLMKAMWVFPAPYPISLFLFHNNWFAYFWLIIILKFLLEKRINLFLVADPAIIFMTLVY